MNTLTLTTTVKRSARTLQLEGMFDLGETKVQTVNIECLDIAQLDAKPWNVGLIVGPSGAGKTTSARQTFAEQWRDAPTWEPDVALVDGFPPDMSLREITNLLSSVGFGSPPSWLRPYNVLSNGEKFRADVARALAETNDITVIDEFTSVVDRQVAQVGSHAIAKTVRRNGSKFVAVTCHYDIEEWLQPDWVYQPHIGQLTWRSVQPRPQVNVEIIRCGYETWDLFRQHHYLSQNFSKGARTVVASIDGRPIALCAVMPMPHGSVHNAWRIHRIVVLPDWQGIGIGSILTEAVAAGMKALGKVVYITTSHPGLIASFNRSRKWSMTRKPSHVALHKNLNLTGGSFGRVTAGFKYAGAADAKMGQVMA